MNIKTAQDIYDIHKLSGALRGGCLKLKLIKVALKAISSILF